MKILIADDDEVGRLSLGAMLSKRGYEVVTASNGKEALEALQRDDSLKLAILDWMMPETDGVEVCSRVRQDPDLRSIYVILLTGRGSKENVVQGLRAGANDYLTKPFDRDELEARVNVAAQVVRLQSELANQVRQLEAALSRVKQLQGLLPICSYCKSIRDDQDYWHQVDQYLQHHTEAQFSHGVCPSCWDKVVRPGFEKLGIPLPQS